MQTFTNSSGWAFATCMVFTGIATGMTMVFASEPTAAGITLMLGFAVSAGMGAVASVRDYIQSARSNGKTFASYEHNGRTYVDDFGAIRKKMAAEAAARKTAREELERRYDVAA